MRTELDPQVAATVEEIEATGIPAWHTMSVGCARRVEDEVFTTDESPAVPFVRNLSISAASELPIRVYRPDRELPVPTIVYFHGGGWVLGTLDSIDGLCSTLADRTGCVVVSVDYRLAPEHPFPAAVDDAYAAIEWVAENARAFGGDPDRLSVAGTSSGGNLAAVTALRARTFDGPTLDHQLLLYPITDHDFERDSYTANANGPLLTRADMQWFWEQYLRSPVDGHNPFASPLRAPDLSNLPPATVITCGHDPLRDEGCAYAERLDRADHYLYPSVCHGFLSMIGSVDVADSAMDEITQSVRKYLR